MKCASKLVPRHPCRIQYLMNHIEYRDVRLASQRPVLSLLTLHSFHCLLCLTEARQLRWCDVQTFDGSLSTRNGTVSGSSTSTEWQVLQPSSRYFWNVLESVRWSILSGPHFLITDSIQQFGLLLHHTPALQKELQTAVAPWRCISICPH